MSVIQFRKAVKYDARGRVALVGPPGSGKSFTALGLARLLAGPSGKIAAVDTEHGSLSKYADLSDFDVIELDSYTPENFIAALTAAEDNKYDVFLCDSLSHFWMGKDGALEFVDERKKRASSRGGDQMEGWKDWRPHERMMVDRMIGSSCHVVTTLRTKNEYRDEEYINGRGERKTKRVKIGLAPVQREGLEYEFDLVGLMSDENDLIVDKTRCSDYAGKVLSKPGPKEFEPFRNWLQGAKRSAVPVQTAVAAPTAVSVSWDWRTVLPAFDRVETQVGHARFMAMLGSNGFTSLEDVPRNREDFAKLYKTMQAEMELFGTDPIPEPVTPPSASEPNTVIAQSASIALPTPQQPTKRNGMPLEVEQLWKRMSSFPAMLGVLSDLKKDLIELAGMDSADKLYGDILGRHGATSAHSFRNLGKARQCASALWEQIQLLKHPPMASADASDDGKAAA